MGPALVPRQFVELFHLSFLRCLAQGAARSHFTLKGGCNLRFFFGSIRYSEDLDLDVRVVARATLKNKVDRILEGPALLLPLKAQGITAAEISAPKQTDTTQRWKIGLTAPGLSVPLRTKVEFSRREETAGAEAVVAEAVSRELAKTYGMPPPVVQHYRAEAALTQKVRALVGRPETQARDVFDLHLLRPKVADLPELPTALRAELPKAIERVLGLSYGDYLSQVVAYLASDYAAIWRDRAVWDSMQFDTIELLEELGR